MNKLDTQRQVKWRKQLIKHASETGNVAKTCRHFGISRTVFYKWIKRFEAHGEASLCDQAKTPHKPSVQRLGDALRVIRIPFAITRCGARRFTPVAELEANLVLGELGLPQDGGDLVPNAVLDAYCT